MKISLIVAMGENRVIGAGGKIPWRLPADFRYFQKTTTGHPVVMGRKTFESIGRPLPGRTNIVITRDGGYRAEGIAVAGSLEDALAAAERSEGADEIFILGGGQIYALAMPLAHRLYVTVVHGAFDGDAFFPEIDDADWALASRESHAKDEENPFDFDFLVYERKGATMNEQ
jgi:dihydrofolate reductase